MCRCACEGRFFARSGPLSQVSPVPTYSASVTGIVFSGSISLVIDNGEICKGAWALVSSAPAKNGDPPAANMSADWNLVYGQGYYVAHVLGNKLYARATLTGNLGTTLSVEFSNENNTRGNTKGVAQDNRGNVFKVTVYN
jgi:hypothetical protein